MMNIYETPGLVAEYLLFHYGTPEEVLPWDFGPQAALGFAIRSVNELIDRGLVPTGARALDLGCAVGRSSYELARVAEEVRAIDFSHSFIHAAERVRSGFPQPYLRVDEGMNETMLDAVRPPDVDAARIRFEQGDAMNLSAELGEFDVVHAANLLCRLAEPQRLLARLPSLVKKGGQLLLTTPCTWLKEFTPVENWPLGSTFDWLQEALSPHFTLAHRQDLPFLIREHARKYQWSVALGTRWVRR